MQQYARRGNSPVAEEITGKQIKAGIKCNDGERADHDYSAFPVANFRPQLCRRSRQASRAPQRNRPCVGCVCATERGAIVPQRRGRRGHDSSDGKILAAAIALGFGLETSRRA